MKLVIVRHGDPDYEHDTLTETGWREAEMLSDCLAALPAKEYYVSPLGRARDTASCTMKKLGREPIVLDWLQEFPNRIIRPDQPEKKNICWDWLPQDWMADERFFSAEHWHESEIMQAGHVKETYDEVIAAFDALLAQHGYVRDGNWYKAVQGNNDTIVLFCHFGLECVLLSHLMHVSPMILWHTTCAAPTSVTTVVTEERRPGIASFRMLRFGDVSHLFLKNSQPSFAARFCEMHGNPGERVD